jgi:hypothetical protein
LLEGEQREESRPVLEVRRCTICVDVPDVELQSTVLEMVCQTGHEVLDEVGVVV